MSTLVPSFLNGCITPNSAGNTLLLIGSPRDGVLEVYKLVISPSINRPSAILLYRSNDVNWREANQLSCYNYPDSLNPRSIYIQQSGSPSVTATFESNATVASHIVKGRALPSSKFMTRFASVLDWNWYFMMTTESSGQGIVRWYGLLSINDGDKYSTFTE
jgi:hypothetical protein